MLNASAQPGDIAYYIPANTQVGGFSVNINNANIITIGVILDILTTALDPSIGDGSTQTLVCQIDDTTPEPDVGDFVFFGKDRSVNEASIIGYYGKLRFKNNSREKAELFNVGCDVNVSS